MLVKLLPAIPNAGTSVQKLWVLLAVHSSKANNSVDRHPDGLGSSPSILLPRRRLHEHHVSHRFSRTRGTLL